MRRRLGSGGFATVWLAHDEQLDAEVAIKVLADNWGHDDSVRRRFLEEGRFLRRVESEHVVQVHDVGELEDGRPFLVLTYADRGTLADRLKKEPLPLVPAVGVIVQVGRGLQALHRRGLLHRDVKPANVLFRSTDEGERAVLSDLGLGKALDEVSRITMPGGTPSYVAPEQAMGERLDQRADQYSLGAVAYAALTGRSPHQVDGLGAAGRVKAPPPPSSLGFDIPEKVDAAIVRALDPDREKRWPDVESFARELVGALDETTHNFLPAAGRPGTPLPLPLANAETEVGEKTALSDSNAPTIVKPPTDPATTVAAADPASAAEVPGGAAGSAGTVAGSAGAGTAETVGRADGATSAEPGTESTAETVGVRGAGAGSAADTVGFAGARAGVVPGVGGAAGPGGAVGSAVGAVAGSAATGGAGAGTTETVGLTGGAAGTAEAVGLVGAGAGAVPGTAGTGGAAGSPGVVAGTDRSAVGTDAAAGKPRRRRGRWVLAAVLALVVGGGVGFGGQRYLLREPVVEVTEGSFSVEMPREWAGAVAQSDWRPPGAEDAWPALRVSRDESWLDGNSPGLFVGVMPADGTPAEKKFPDPAQYGCQSTEPFTESKDADRTVLDQYSFNCGDGSTLLQRIVVIGDAADTLFVQVKVPAADQAKAVEMADSVNYSF